MTITLRPYQEQALEAERRHRREHPDETRLAIVMATGLGKGTIIAERACRFLREVPDEDTDLLRFASPSVLILAHTDEIVSDLAARCRLAVSGWDFSVGIVKAGQDETDADIVVASVQTLAQPDRRERIRDVGLVIVDECHHSAAAGYEAILRHFGCFGLPCQYCTTTFGTGHASICDLRDKPLNTVPALGFTATLERGDGASLGGIWQDVCFTRDISWGVRHGHLVQPVGHRLEINSLDLRPGIVASAGKLDASLIEALAPEKIVEKWIELAKDRPTVAFMPLVRSARVLSCAFHDSGIRAAVIWGDMPAWQRREALAAYEAGHIQVLCNAMVLTEGWDSPQTSCVIVGRPTKSRALFVQMAGRGLRPAPGVPVEEQDCILIAVADATTDLCSVADLSDRPIDRKAQGALTAMEDAFDLGAELADETRFWTGQVDATQFDPLVSRSSKVWRTTKHGTPFLPISKDGEYVFIVGTSVFVRAGNYGPGQSAVKVSRLHKDLPDLELAMQAAEDEAQERGGDLGRLLADKKRPWRQQRPSDEMLARAYQLGLRAEVDKIMSARAGGKAGKVSDLISRVVATRALEPMVERIKEATK